MSVLLSIRLYLHHPEFNFKLKKLLQYSMKPDLLGLLSVGGNENLH